MASDFWSSTQYSQWQFTREKLSDIRTSQENDNQVLIQAYPLPEWRHLSIFFNQQLVKLGRRMAVRQQALATAQVFIRRYYIRVQIRDTNPYLVMATALYLACKVEECPQPIRVIVSEARNIWQDFVVPEVSKIGECEFSLLSVMECQLIIHHPYRTLSDLQKPLSLGPDDSSLAWSIINDHYLTDLPLLVPPHVVAVTAIFLAVTLKPSPAGLQAAASTASILASALQAQANPNLATMSAKLNPAQLKIQNLVSWIAKGELDIKAVVECSQEMISVYDVWESYNEKTCKEQINRFVKVRALDK